MINEKDLALKEFKKLAKGGLVYHIYTAFAQNDYDDNAAEFYLTFNNKDIHDYKDIVSGIMKLPILNSNFIPFLNEYTIDSDNFHFEQWADINDVKYSKKEKDFQDLVLKYLYKNKNKILLGFPIDIINDFIYWLNNRFRSINVNCYLNENGLFRYFHKIQTKKYNSIRRFKSKNKNEDGMFFYPNGEIVSFSSSAFVIREVGPTLALSKSSLRNNPSEIYIKDSSPCFRLYFKDSKDSSKTLDDRI